MKVFKKNLKLILGFIIGIILASSLTVYAYNYFSSDIQYTDNKTVSDALNELYSKIPSGFLDITENGVYDISNKESVNVNVKTNSYDENVYDVWTTWLKLAGIDEPEQYNNQNIIENETLFNMLLNNENARKYMCNSKYYILPAIINSETAMDCLLENNDIFLSVIANENFRECLNNSGKMEQFENMTIKIPQQEGVDNSKLVYSGTLLNNTVPQNAFDGIEAAGWDDNRMWQDQTESDDGYIGYNYGKPTVLYKFDLNAATYKSVSNKFSFIVEGLKENGTWEQIGDEYIAEFSSYNSFITKTYNVENDKCYYGYRLKNNYSKSGHGNRFWAIYADSGFGIGELTFYCYGKN